MLIYDKKRTCSKCNGVAKSVFNIQVKLIDRICSRCGFLWQEKPLDSSDENKNESNDSSEEKLLLG